MCQELVWSGCWAEQSELVAERTGKAGLLDREGLLVFWHCTLRYAVSDLGTKVSFVTNLNEVVG